MEQNQEAKKFKFFSHKECEYFPCHKVKDKETFNCLFCYCPLYALGPECGGNFKYGESGIKDCSDCLIPHSPGGFEYIMERFPKISDLAKQNLDK